MSKSPSFVASNMYETFLSYRKVKAAHPLHHTLRRCVLFINNFKVSTRDDNELDLGRILDSSSLSDLDFLSLFPHPLEDWVFIPYPNTLFQFVK